MAQNLPEYERKTAINASNDVSGFSDAYERLGAAQNSLSELGATVAQSASQQLATQLGYQQGQNPSGDTLPAITNFDKTYTQAYQTQAHSTLALQGQKLLLDTEVQLAQSPKLTPELIDEANKTVAQGLNSIAEKAPTAVKGNLKAQFGSLMLNQNQKYTMKMLAQQRAEQKDVASASVKNSVLNTYNLASIGNLTAAQDAVKANNAAVESAYNTGLFTRVQADTAKETANQAFLNARYIYIAKQYQQAGKLGDFEKDFLNTNQNDLTPEQKQKVGAAILSHFSYEDSLNKQSETLALGDFQLKILDGHPITGQDLADLQQKISPEKYNNVLISLKKEQLKQASASAGMNAVVTNFSNPTVMSQASSENLNAGWYKLIEAKKQDNAQKNISQSDAEIKTQLLANSAVPIPAMTKEINAKGASTNPQDLQEIGATIDYVYAHGKGQNLNDVSMQAQAAVEVYRGLLGSKPPEEAAQEAHDIVYNKKEEQVKQIMDQYSDWLKTQKAAGLSANQMWSSILGIKPEGDIQNTAAYTAYLQRLHRAFYIETGGDLTATQKMLQQTVNQNFGVTNVNNVKEYALHPIEKTLNLPSNSVGVIHSQIATQLDQSFAEGKQLFDEGKMDSYYQVAPRISLNQAIAARQKITEIRQKQLKNPISSGVFDLGNDRKELDKAQKVIDEFNTKGAPEVYKIYRGRPAEKYNVEVEASPALGFGKGNQVVGGYSLKLRNADSVMNIAVADPLGKNYTYYPSKADLEQNYMAVNPPFEGSAIKVLTRKDSLQLFGNIAKYVYKSTH